MNLVRTRNANTLAYRRINFLLINYGMYSMISAKVLRQYTFLGIHTIRICVGVAKNLAFTCIRTNLKAGRMAGYRASDLSRSRRSSKTASIIACHPYRHLFPCNMVTHVDGAHTKATFLAVAAE